MASEQPYREGQLLLGSDGKTYKVAGGVPREVIPGRTAPTSGQARPILSRSDPDEVRANQRIAMEGARLGMEQERLGLAGAQEARAQLGVAQDKEMLKYRLSTQVAGIDEQIKRAKNLLENPARTSISGSVQGLLPDFAFSIGELFGEKDALDALADWKALTGPAGLAELGELRAQSPTGGAVGQVSDFEQKLLQQAAGRFTNRQQSDESFDEAIRDYVAKLEASRSRLINAYKGGFGENLFPTAPKFTVKRRN